MNTKTTAVNNEGVARRVIVPEGKYFSEELLPGVMFNKFYPGGKEGPNNDVHNNLPGGQAWSEYLLVGDQNDPFQLMLPDIRMPANQYWPLHWHDTWTVVLVLEGSCTVGDWTMEVGDIFITVPGLEYGPLLIGPKGCRLFEIFAKGHLADGGYSPEYRDHLTLQGTNAVFKQRLPLNKRNDGHQTLSLVDLEDIIQTRLEPGARWDLGDSKDPDRGFMGFTCLSAGEVISKHSYGDWHAMVVLEGEIEVCGKKIERDGHLLIRPGSPVEDIVAGASGAQLLELARTVRGADRIDVS